MAVVFVLVDALGWDVVRDRQFLTDVLPHQQELQTVFGFSSAAIPSILTGLLPRDHNHWNLFVYDPSRSPFRWAKFLRLLPSRWSNSRVVRKAVSVIGRKVSRTQGYFQIYGVPVEILPMFDVCEKEDIYELRGLHPTRSIFDLLEEKQLPWRSYSYHHFSDERAVEQAIQDLRNQAAGFYFVYLSELDNFLHYHIHDAARVAKELERYDRLIRRLLEAALAEDPDAPFYVLSDHGMTAVGKTFDLMAEIRQLGWKVPQDYLALYDSTMARFWFFHDRAESSIRTKLDSLSCGRVVTAEEQAAFGIDFGHNRFGDLVFLMNEGCLMHPSHMGRVPWAGMHGFHPQAPSSSAALLARRPPPVPASHVKDVFHLMRQEAGLA